MGGIVSNGRHSKEDDEEYIGSEVNLGAIFFSVFFLSNICRNAMSNSDTRTDRNLSIESREGGLQIIEINICWLCDLPGIKTSTF